MAPTDGQEQVAVLLIAHGSRHAPANDDLHQLAGRFAGRAEYPIVEPCFLELADPDIPTGGDRCVARGASRVLMIPYFLSAGVHLIRDLTAARDALRSRHPGVEFRLGPPLGPHPLLDDLVSHRIRQIDTEDGAPAFASSSELAERYAPMDGHRPA
jgi:sirohydrochlorin ferrochelatase